MSTNENSQIVFIDSRVPDLQGLLAGLSPGEQAFVLDPSSDGVQQIADILAANNITDVSSISIVSHGETGELELGSSLVTDGSLASHAAALAQIGAALAPDGSIQLFGCDVAQGATGQQFIDDFSALAGGAPVEASTQLVGSADTGGSWTLDASSVGSSAPVVSQAPFTSQALANFQGALVVTHPDGELFYLINAADNELGDISSTGTTGTEVFGDGTNDYATIAVDPAAGLVFTNGQGIANTGVYNSAVVHSATTGAVLATVTFGPNDGNINTDDVVNAVAINPFTNTLLVGDWGADNAHTGVREFTYTASGALTPVATNNGFLFTSTQTGGEYTDAMAMYLDTKNNLLYYVDDDSGYDFSPFQATNGVYVVSTTGPTFSPTELTSNGSGTGQFPTADQQGAGTNIGANGNIVALAVNVAQGIVYFETTFTDSENSPHNALWWVNTRGANQTATQITLPSGLGLFPGQSSEGGDAAGLTFDPQTRQLYVTNAFETNSDPNPSDIYVFQLDSTGHTITSTVETLGSQALLNQAPGTVNPDETPGPTTFDVLPVLTATGTSSSPVERGAAVTLAASLSATDADGNHFVSATVSITGGTFTSNENSTSDDHLSVNGTTSGVLGGTSITVSYNSATETLTLTGYDTISNYQTALNEIEFQATGHNPTNYGSDTTRTVTWTVSDGATNIPAGSQNSGTTTVTVTAVNDPPTLSNVATSQSYTEGAAPATLSSAVTVSDPDNLDLASATVSITGGTFASDGDVLATTTTGTSISASYNSTTETLTLTGSDTLALYQTVLDKITFNSTSNNPTDFGSEATRTVTWVLNDGSGSFNTSTPITTTVSITAVNNPPTLSNVATSAAFTEGAAAVTLSSNVTVSDPDNLNLASATVAVTGGAFVGDVLSADTTGLAITASYNSSTETLTLTGSDTLAHYQAVLDKVAFNSTSLNPTDYGSDPTRLVTWVLNDGGGSNNTSTAATTTVSITAVNNPPTLSNVATSQSYTEGAAPATLSSAVTVSDPDDLDLASATVSITGGTFTGDGDVLSTTTTGTSISASYNSSTETLTLTGADTLAHYQAVLDKVAFNSTSLNPTDYRSDAARLVTWVLKDPSGTANGGSDTSTAVTTTVDITAVNNPPTLSNVATSASFTEESPAVTLSPSVTVSDPDDLKLASATVTITGGTFAGDGDVLATSTAGTSISASYNSTTETLTLTGSDTLADYQQVLDAVTFAAGENPTDFGSHATRTVTWVANDGGGSNNLSTAATTTVSVTNVNDPPTLSSVVASVIAVPSTPVTLSPSVTVTDPDNLTLASATVAVTGGTFNGDGDVLAATTTGTSITASYNSTTETLTLSGTDSHAHYQQVLDSVTFDTTATDPTNGGADPSRTISWVVNDGGSSFNLSTPQFTTVSVLSALSSGQTIFVSASQTSSGIVVTSGSEIVVLSGGTAEDIFVLSSGVEAVDAGGTASGTIVSSGGIQYDAGTASNTVLSGGNQQVFGSAAGTTIDNGGTQDVVSGATASGTTVSSGGIQYDAGTASNTVLSGGTQVVFGSAAGTTISSGGTQDVTSGGIASGTTVSSGGTQYDAGTASGTALSGGTQVVFGSAANTTISSGGAQDVVAGGIADNATVSSGGTQYDAGTASNVVLSGGTQQVFGIAASTTISSGGTQDVVAGGIATGTTVSSGGTQFDAGTASNTTLDGGTENVFGSDVSATVNNGGTQNVVAGGIASGTTVSSGGIQYDAGTASATILSGGTQVVFGSSLGTTIDSGGTQDVVSVGTASGTTVSGGGIQYDAGSAIATTLSGGTTEVFSGGSISGATIGSGLLELQSGATAGNSTITFAGGGTLRLDATGAYSFLVAGFGVPDQFDLSQINFASATSAYDPSTGALTVGDGTHSASILLLGNYTAGNFKLNPETGGGTGTVVTDPPLTNSAFLAGSGH